MASFEEYSIPSKIDSSNAENARNTGQNDCIDSLPTGENNNINVNGKRLTMVDKATASSTMENVMADNQTSDIVHSNNAFAATATEPIASAAQSTCRSVAENVVSSTQETTIDSLKMVNESNERLCDIANANSVPNEFPLTVMQANCLPSDVSHVANASAMDVQSKQREASADDSKRHFHVANLSSSKSKSTENG